jgi:hypothetical protein
MATELPDLPEPIADGELDHDDSLSADLTVAARALLLGAALHSQEAVDTPASDLTAIGMHDLPPPVTGVRGYRALVADSSIRLGAYGRLGKEVEQFERLPGRPVHPGTRVPIPPGLWREASAGDPVAAVAWLRATQMAERDVRQVGAAAALDPVARSQWRDATSLHNDEIPEIRAARRLLNEYTDNTASAGGSATAVIAREIATAATGGSEDSYSEGQPSNGEAPARPMEHPFTSISTMVHGTMAYVGSWWTPHGDFHRYIRECVTRDLYSGGQYYSWSGRYSNHHREVAAARLYDWSSPYLHRMNSVYAHSYGGIIALRALGLGLHIDELVLLSTPNDDVETDLSRVGRITSLRIHMDLVLLAARRRQSFDLPVAEHYLPRWFISHGDSHDTSIWTQHDVVRALSIGALRR